MADYHHINEKDKIDIKCPNCGEIVSFKVLDINNATACRCGRVILRSSIKVRDAIDVLRKASRVI